MTPRLPRPSSGSRHPIRSRNEGTWLALVMVLGIAGGLIGLVAVILPDIIGLVVVAQMFCAMIVLHYFTWGRWLTRVTAQETKATELADEEVSPVDDNDEFPFE
jgi:hypothetical protein